MKKTSHVAKKQDNLRYVFIYKKPGTLRYAISYGIFVMFGGGETFFYLKNNALCVAFLYPQV